MEEASTIINNCHVPLLENRNADLVNDQDAIPYTDCIFQQPWWLDAVAPGRYEAVEVKVDGKVRARLPYVVRTTLGVKVITMPLLTPYLGPWFAPSNAKYVNQLGEQKELLNELIDQLPPHDYFVQSCHHSFKNWLPFYWRNFKASTSYTFIFEKLGNLNKVWNGIRTKTRGQIRKAMRQLVVRPGEDIDEFLKLAADSFARRGLVLSKGFLEVGKRIDAACAPRKARQMFFAEDAKGQVHAAIYNVLDNNCVYALMAGENAELRDSAGASLVAWESLKFAAATGRNFDFCGSTIESIEKFLRGFGGELRPYFIISRLSRRGRVMMAGKELLNRLQRNRHR